jgi:hypothetical protein
VDKKEEEEETWRALSGLDLMVQVYGHSVKDSGFILSGVGFGVQDL